MQCCRLTVRLAADTDVYKDIARVPEIHRKDGGGNVIPEGNVCRIRAADRSAFVILRGQQGSGDAAIWLDERTRNKLQVSVGQEKEFQFEPQGLWGQLWWAWDATDIAYRVAARLAVLSVVLGGLGLIIGIISLVVSFRGPRP